MFGALLALSSSALAVEQTPLPSRLSKEIKTFTTEEILREFGPMKKGGTPVGKLTRALPKIGKFVRYGGLIGITGLIVNEALNSFYEAGKTAITPGLQDWMKGSPAPKAMPQQIGSWQYQSYLCASSSGYHYGYYAYDASTTGIFELRPDGGQGFTSGQPATSGAAAAQAWLYASGTCTTGTSLADAITRSPATAQEVADIVADYVGSRPGMAPRVLEPIPNVNEEADDVVDPGLDTDRDGVTDGDEVRRGPGVLTNPGNRPHPADGQPTDPADPLSKPLDTDKDGIPDWRDGDDDGDGAPDNEETEEGQKDKNITPDRYRDTDGDGVPDSEDLDDDGDGFPDDVEEREGSNPKDPSDKPTDKPCGVPGEVRGPSGSCQPEEEEEEKPKECTPGSSLGQDGKTCEPDKEEEKCPEGKKSDGGEPPKCVDDSDDKGPVKDDCGDFAIKRLLTHTGHYLRDVVFPCEDYDWTKFSGLVSNKFPFSVAASMGTIFKSDVSGSSPSPLPTKLGMFDIDIGFAASFLAAIKLMFRAAVWWLFFSWLAGRLSGQVVLS